MTSKFDPLRAYKTPLGKKEKDRYDENYDKIFKPKLKKDEKK